MDIETGGGGRPLVADLAISFQKALDVVEGIARWLCTHRERERQQCHQAASGPAKGHKLSMNEFIITGRTGYWHTTLLPKKNRACVKIVTDHIAKVKIMAQLSTQIIEAAIDGFEAQKQRIDVQIAELRAMLSPNGSAPASKPAVRRKRGMSAAGRKAIAAAQRKRWAASKGESVAPKVTKKPKRRLSAAGKANIIAALKKRWAAKKAEAAAKSAPTAKKAARTKAA